MHLLGVSAGCGIGKCLSFSFQPVNVHGKASPVDQTAAAVAADHHRLLQQQQRPQRSREWSSRKSSGAPWWQSLKRSSAQAKRSRLRLPSNLGSKCQPLSTFSWTLAVARSTSTSKISRTKTRSTTQSAVRPTRWTTPQGSDVATANGVIIIIIAPVASVVFVDPDVDGDL